MCAGVSCLYTLYSACVSENYTSLTPLFHKQTESTLVTSKPLYHSTKTKCFPFTYTSLLTTQQTHTHPDHALPLCFMHHKAWVQDQQHTESPTDPVKKSKSCFTLQLREWSASLMLLGRGFSMHPLNRHFHTTELIRQQGFVICSVASETSVGNNGIIKKQLDISPPQKS